MGQLYLRRELEGMDPTSKYNSRLLSVVNPSKMEREKMSTHKIGT